MGMLAVGTILNFMTILSGRNTLHTPTSLLSLALLFRPVLLERLTNNATPDFAWVLIRKGSQKIYRVMFLAYIEEYEVLFVDEVHHVG